MTLDLSMADFDMLNDAVFQRAGDATNEREEDRWLTLQAKLSRAAVDLERSKCQCEHARKSHRGDGRDKCLICQCKSFQAASEPTD